MSEQLGAKSAGADRYLNAAAEIARALQQRAWPRNTVIHEACALAEEAGEVCRAVIKRDEGTRFDKDWTAEVRKELGQVLLVALAMCHGEGIDAHALVVESLESLTAKVDAIDAARSGEATNG